jgi:predicted TIM-barrel fold metal-dependent hydrolase
LAPEKAPIEIVRRPARTKGPIFIVGTMGSGTTLLRLMLDSHERIAIPHETGFMRAYDAMQFIPFKWTGRGWARRLGWGQEDLDEKLREFFDDIFMRYAKEHGKKRWGEKTPLHTWHITAMKRVFPDAVFIAIVRHPGATIASNMRRFGRTAPEAAYHHVRYNKEIARQAAKMPRRMIILRYEDLLLHTERAMRELLHWLGEPWSDRVLQHHVVQATERDHERIEGKTRASDSVDPSRIAQWTSELSDADRKVLSGAAARVGEFYGYSMEDPEALAPLGNPRSLLFGGRGLRKRVEQFSDLDIYTQMPVPLYDHRLDPRHFELKRLNQTASQKLVDRVRARVRR